MEHGCGWNPGFKKSFFAFSSAKLVHSMIFLPGGNNYLVTYNILPRAVLNT